MLRLAYQCSLAVLLVVLAITNSQAQQFVGLGNPISSIQLLPQNPAYVTSAATGVEVNVVSGSVLLGNNAVSASRDLIRQTIKGEDLNPQKGVDYFIKDKLIQNKANSVDLWANVDVLGPSAMFTVKKKYQVGVFTRFRTIVNMGGGASSTFDTLVNVDLSKVSYRLSFNDIGVITHAFSEVGVSVGTMLSKGDYYELYGGMSIKHLTGFAAVGVSVPTASYERRRDSIIFADDKAFDAEGTANLFFTHDDPQDMAGGPGAGSGWGVDIGVQYVYYEKAERELDWGEKRKYKWRLAASITDIGSIKYNAATGSGSYTVSVPSKTEDYFDFPDAEAKASFFLNNDSILALITDKVPYTESVISLPTALRLGGDYNVTDKFNVSFNALLNLAGNKTDLYRPAYVGYANITPRVSLASWLHVGVPVTFTRLKRVDIGAVLYAGPLFVGSATAITSGITNKSVSHIDAYAGLALKLYKRTPEPKKARPKTRHYKSFKGVFKRRGASDVACPPGQ